MIHLPMFLNMSSQKQVFYGYRAASSWWSMRFHFAYWTNSPPNHSTKGRGVPVASACQYCWERWQVSVHHTAPLNLLAVGGMDWSSHLGRNAFNTCSVQLHRWVAFKQSKYLSAGEAALSWSPVDSVKDQLDQKYPMFFKSWRHFRFFW